MYLKMVEESQVKNAAKLIVESIGAGMTERIYQNCIEAYLRKINTPFTSEQEIPVMFLNENMGNVRADLVVNGCLVVELKATNHVSANHTTQCRMYMKLLKINKGLIINFPKSDDEELYFENVHLTEDVPDCRRCGRQGHTAMKCYAKHHINGNILNIPPLRSM